MYSLDTEEEQQPLETLHLYAVYEDELPHKPDMPSLLMAIAGCLCIVGILLLSLVSATLDSQQVAFPLALQGYALAPVVKTVHTRASATGKGHVAATVAHGSITFYNGAIYTQIIPVGTILRGSDGVTVITDTQAIIPPAAETFPPTYGQTHVPAHAVIAGLSGNIGAGDINEACCVTSVIAQNPYSFTGGKNARDYTYITQTDVSKAVATLQPQLEQQTLVLFPMVPVLDATCSNQTQTKGMHVTVIETCRAFSYDGQRLTSQLVARVANQFGKGHLSHVELAVIEVSHTGFIQFYVMGTWNPQVMRRYWEGK